MLDKTQSLNMDLKVIILVSFIGISFASLRSDFKGFMSTFGENYDRRQLKERFKLYQDRRNEIERHNKNSNKKWSMAINHFTAMTTQERSQYLGLNNESVPLDTSTPLMAASRLRLRSSNPESVDHVDLGHVTRPKEQRSCGSCWAFAAVAAIEGAYAQLNNVLKSFSEKEILDCTYNYLEHDACHGGMTEDAWLYIKKNQRLATLEEVPYDFARHRSCYYAHQDVPNGLKNVLYERRYKVEATDDALETAVAERVLAVSMIVEDDFWGYDEGVYGGCENEDSSVNHAVTMVGYTADSWKVKNSWGRDWGENGYVRFSRATENNCRLAEFAMYPSLVRDERGEEEDEADPETLRPRWPDHGCSFGDGYPCSDNGCNYGCQDGYCWSQCNGFCGVSGYGQVCANCMEWCWLDATCDIHEDCFEYRYDSCDGSCSV